ncbi:MAG TPA: hypothetical protein VJJ26_03025, partial [Candidatus Babeliales bacterium]|nr:hypothetical protein [Candidatus Babeliales bacterium]
SGFTKTTSNAFIKQLHSVVENEALFAGEYTVEVAGFGKLIVEEGAEVSIKAADSIKNNLTFFTSDNKNIFKISYEVANIAHDINNGFEQLIKSATMCLKGNNTSAGRAFQKHAARQGSAFVGEITGNAAKNTEQAMNYINMIIKSHDSTFVIRSTNSYGDILDIRLPDGMGARWTSDGSKFIGFLERYTMKQ